MPVLTFFKEERLLFEHRLTSRRTVIGRSDQCDVALPVRGQQLHCWIEQHGEKVVLVDRSNMELVKGELVERRALKVATLFTSVDIASAARSRTETEVTVEVLPKRATNSFFNEPECLVNCVSVVGPGIDKGRMWCANEQR